MKKIYGGIIVAVSLMIHTIISNTLLAQQDTIRVVHYSLLKYPGTTPERADSIRIILDYLKPDILCVTELLTSSAADMILNSSLNHSGKTNYARTIYYDGFDTETLLFYNTEKLGLIRTDSISTAGSTSVGSSRYIGYSRLFFKDPNLSIHRDTQYLDVTHMHLTASNSSSDSLSRYAQTKMLKNWLNIRPQIKFLLTTGDFNMYTDQEVGYQTLLDSGSLKLKDPINRPGRWHGNASFADVHTQSTRVRAFNGGATGGLDDRFDFILTSDSILQSNRLKYIPNTYRVIANNGQLFNDSLTHPPNSTLVPWPVLSALYNASDHLPIYLELLAPHKQVVSVTENAWENLSLTVSPNPTQGILNLVNQTGTQETFQVTIADLNGKILLTQEFTQNCQWDLSSLPAGIYLLKASDGNRQANQKIILSK
jgi:endonuclease/exonuclease/phosphatase family metal-dependent hydrolase